MLSSVGARIGSPISTGRSGIATALAFDGTNYLLIWEDDGLSTLTGDTGWAVYGQFISTTGSPVGAPFPISSVGVWFDGIKPLAFGGGKYLVTYTRLINPSRGDTFDNRYIAGRVLNTDGSSGSEFRISTGFGQASDVAFGATNFFVVWCEDSADKEIRGRFISSTGVPGDEIVVNGSAASSDNPKSVAFDGANYMVIWNDEVGGKGSGAWDCFGQLVGPTGTLIGGVIPIATDVGEQMATTVAFDGTNYLAAWLDMANGTNWDLYAQFIGRSGSLTGGRICLSTEPGNQLGGVGFGNGKYVAMVNNGVEFGDSGIGAVDSAEGMFVLPLPALRIQIVDPNFGVQNGNFGFTITGPSGQVVVVETSAGPDNPSWSPAATNSLKDGSWLFRDPQWIGYSTRLYRAVSR